MGEDKSREDVIAVSRSDSSLRAGVFPYLCGACRGVAWILADWLAAAGF